MAPNVIRGAAAFFGASALETHAASDAIVLLALLAGIAMLISLVTFEYLIENPLMPVRQAASTFPVAGIVVAMCAGAASVAVIELAQTALKSESPTHVGLLFLPEFAAAAGVAVIFGLLFRTRWIPLLLLAGMIAPDSCSACSHWWNCCVGWPRSWSRRSCYTWR